MTDNRTTELLPCPFCGGEAELKEYKPNVSGVAICMECGARSSICKNNHTGGWKPKAVEAWNTRTATTDTEFARAVHDGNLWRRVKGHIRCPNCGLNIESVIALDGCNEHAIKHCPNCGHKVVD